MTRRILVCILYGLIADAAATFISILTMGAGHGTNLAAYIMVSWAMMLLIADQAGNSIVHIAMLAQFEASALTA